MDLSQLRFVVNKAQETFNAESIDISKFDSIMNELAEGGYSYDKNKFPALVNTELFADEPDTTPSSLAEALLWKLGKWNSYVKFATQYHDPTTTPTNTDTVFYAFARHLRDNSNLIYDQHALRALWAIDDTLNDSDVKNIKSVLINSGNTWKQTGSGANTTDCYEVFTNHVNLLVDKGIDARKLDDFLMPMGQALKKVATDYSQFSFVCGWNTNYEA